MYRSVMSGQRCSRCACDRLGNEGKLHKSSGPGNHSQRDFILLQLQHGDEGRVVHSHRRGTVHCHYLIAAPAQINQTINMDNLLVGLG